MEITLRAIFLKSQMNSNGKRHATTEKIVVNAQNYCMTSNSWTQEPWLNTDFLSESIR